MVYWTCFRALGLVEQGEVTPSQMKLPCVYGVYLSVISHIPIYDYDSCEVP